MRLRRLIEVKSSGKSHVEDDIRQDYKQGGQRREWLEMALLESIAKHGLDRSAFNEVKAG